MMNKTYRYQYLWSLLFWGEAAKNKFKDRKKFIMFNKCYGENKPEDEREKSRVHFRNVF